MEAKKHYRLRLALVPAFCAFAFVCAPCPAPDGDDLNPILKDYLDSLPAPEPEPPPEPFNPRAELERCRRAHVYHARESARRGLQSWDYFKSFGDLEDQQRSKEYAAEAKKQREAANFVALLITDFNSGRLTGEQALEFAHRNIVPAGYTAPEYYRSETQPHAPDPECGDVYRDYRRP